jgi:hypothetical protein
MQSTTGGNGSGSGSGSGNYLSNTPGGTGSDYDKVNGQGLYVLKDSDGNVKYIGRGDAHVRVQTHANTPEKADLDYDILFDNVLSKQQAKGLEQRLIDYFGGAKSTNSSTPLLNRIRGFSPTNPNAQNYRDAVNDEIWGESLNRLNLRSP